MNNSRNNNQRRQNHTNEGSGTIKTLALLIINGKPQWSEVVVDLDKVLQIIEYNGDDHPDTCFLAFNDNHALHVDLSLRQMREIIGEHKRYPMKDFDTHGSLTETGQGYIVRNVFRFVPVPSPV